MTEINLTYSISGGSYEIFCCQERLEVFCQRAKYDPPGQYLAKANPNMITGAQIDLMNSPAMNARSRKASWQPFFGKPLSLLAAVTSDVDLIDADDGAYVTARQTVEALYWKLTSCIGIRDVAASKLSYLHRPKLIAISDSYVRKLLKIPKTNKNWGRGREQLVGRGLAVLDAVRGCGNTNSNVLTQLASHTNGLNYPDGVKVNLSKARILDIYLWTEQAIKQRPFWFKWFIAHQNRCSKNVCLKLGV